jgi:hypothetical protein
MSQPFNCLVDQISGQVVWLSFELESTVPIFDPSLNYLRYNKSTQISVWNLYVSYELYIKNNYSDLVVIPRKSIDKRIQLLRAKAICLAHTAMVIKIHETRQLAPLEMFKDFDCGQMDLVRVLEDVHSLSINQATNLALFKKEEYWNAKRILDSVYLRTLEEVKAASTLQQVTSVYNKTACRLLNINRPELNKLNAIVG